MPQRDEQKAGIADQRKHRPAQHHQRQPASPSDPAEISHPRTQHERQEGETRPEVAVHQQIDWRQAGFEPMPGRGKAQRPAKCGPNAAGDPEKGRPCFCFLGFCDFGGRFGAVGRLDHARGLRYINSYFNRSGVMAAPHPGVLTRSRPATVPAWFIHTGPNLSTLSPCFGQTRLEFCTRTDQ